MNKTEVFWRSLGLKASTRLHTPLRKHGIWNPQVLESFCWVLSGIVVVVLFLVSLSLSLWNLSPTQQLVFRGQLFGILKSCIPNSSIFTQMNILDGSFGRVSIDHDNEYRSFWWGGKNTRVAFVHRFYAPIHSLRCIAVPSISCPLTSDDVPYSLHFALAYIITVIYLARKLS